MDLSRPSCGAMNQNLGRRNNFSSLFPNNETESDLAVGLEPMPFIGMSTAIIPLENKETKIVAAGLEPLPFDDKAVDHEPKRRITAATAEMKPFSPLLSSLGGNSLPCSTPPISSMLRNQRAPSTIGSNQDGPHLNVNLSPTSSETVNEDLGGRNDSSTFHANNGKAENKLAPGKHFLFCMPTTVIPPDNEEEKWPMTAGLEPWPSDGKPRDYEVKVSSEAVAAGE